MTIEARGVGAVALYRRTSLTATMTADEAYDHIGADSAAGAAVQMRKTHDRAGRGLLVAHTQTADMRCIYTFTAV